MASITFVGGNLGFFVRILTLLLKWSWLVSKWVIKVHWVRCWMRQMHNFVVPLFLIDDLPIRGVHYHVIVFWPGWVWSGCARAVILFMYHMNVSDHLLLVRSGVCSNSRHKQILLHALSSISGRILKVPDLLSLPLMLDAPSNSHPFKGTAVIVWATQGTLFIWFIPLLNRAFFATTSSA